jgi:acyl-coenzyme A thioesterase PaaI-like protein
VSIERSEEEHMGDESQEPRGRRWISHWDAATMPASGAWAERRRLAAAMRVVIQRLTTSDAPEQELGAAADALERYAERLSGHPQRTKWVGWAESANAGDVGGFFDQSPLIGLSNPLAPPIAMRAEGDHVRGEVVFGSAYEGPPGCVHGGWVAAAFDEVLGFAQSLTGSPGMTGTLTIRYRQPTPLHTELQFDAWIERVDGRKIFARGNLKAGGLQCRPRALPEACRGARAAHGGKAHLGVRRALRSTAGRLRHARGRESTGAGSCTAFTAQARVDAALPTMGQSRSSRFRIFPVGPLGRASRNSTMRGYL